MSRIYETTADAVNYNDSAKYQIAAQMKGALGADRAQTELESLLGTLRNQAIDIRINVAQLCARVSPQPEEGCGGDKQAFGSGYVAVAEEIRSIQRETTTLLAELSKFA